MGTTGAVLGVRHNLTSSSKFICFKRVRCEAFSIKPNRSCCAAAYKCAEARAESQSTSKLPDSRSCVTIAPASKVSSMLNLSFQPAQIHNTLWFCSTSQSHNTSKFKKEPITRCFAPLATSIAWVPSVVVMAILPPPIFFAGII